MANKKSGYLRFKCRSCGALIKVPHPDPLHQLKKVAANDGDWSIGVHEDCDAERAGITDLIGCTFDEAGT